MISSDVETSIGDSTSQDIILAIPENDSFEPKRYNVDFLLH